MRGRDDDPLNSERIFFQMIRDYSDGLLGNQQHYLRARVEAFDPIGGQLEANPPNPPKSVRARVYSAGLDATTPREALVVFYPLFPPQAAGSVQPGEHVVVVFEDTQKTSGFWLSTVPSFHDGNYANPDFRTQRTSDSSYSFEGDQKVQSSVLPDLEYGGTTTQTEGRQEMVDLAESNTESNPWRGKRVLLIGDSQVAGPFGTKLGELLRGSHEVSYFAKEGRVSWGVLSYLNQRLTASSPIKESIEELLSRHSPDIVVISLGGNDGSSGRASRADYVSKVRELYNIVNQDGRLVIWSGPPTAVGNGARLQPGREVAGRKIREVVQDCYVDVFSITNVTAGRDRMGVHFVASSPTLEPWANEVIQKGYRLFQ